VSAGARVQVRGRSWTLATCEPHSDCDELQLTSLENGRGLILLWPFDRPAAQRVPPQLRVVRTRSWLHHVRAGASADRPPVHLLSGGRGSRAILPYQLAPAIAVAEGARRVLLADEVGLGKTVQAGWIIDDAVCGHQDARVLVAVPAGLRLQWSRELARLFGLDAVVIDARSLLRVVNDLPADINPWTPPGVYIVSLDFLKRQDVTASAVGVTWDVLVVDEAHVAAAPTERYEAVHAIARRARTVVLITATPFSGDDASFSSLISIGATGDAPQPLMFRRSRADVGDARRRRHRFVRVAITPAERQLQRLLERYCGEIWLDAPSREGRLAAIVLRKRALSSAAALGRSLRRRQRLLAASAASAVQLTLFDRDVDDDDEEPGGVLATPGLADTSREHRWLERLIAASDRAGRLDSKVRYLARLLRRIGNEPVVVFTEFRDTLADLAAAFPSALRLHGGMTASERDDVQARFNADGGCLFATDAAAHGLNLQRRCRVVVNFELPWNPARLEQRIGRVDRMGQTRIVHAATLVARDTAEDVVIANIARRLTRVARTLGPNDRLTAFLDDARIAGMAIGGDPIPDLAADCDESPATVVPPAALAEAERLQALASAGRASVSRTRDVAVTSARASVGLPAGFVAMVRWTLQAATGHTAACRTLFLHLPDRPAKPSTAADVRRAAAAAIAAHREEFVERARAEVRPLRETYLAAHARATGSRIAREIEIAGIAPAAAALQPGLFDRRAVDEATFAEAVRDDIREDTSRRIAQLRAGEALEERVDITGLLIIWSRHA
jgi:superfamily II DNA or RNA helicase